MRLSEIQGDNKVYLRLAGIETKFSQRYLLIKELLRLEDRLSNVLTTNTNSRQLAKNLINDMSKLINEEITTPDKDLDKIKIRLLSWIKDLEQYL